MNRLLAPIGTNFWCQKKDVPTRARKRRANACQKKTCQRVPEKDVPTRAKKKKKFNKYSTVIYTSCVYHDDPRPLHVPCTQSAYK